MQKILFIFFIIYPLNLFAGPWVPEVGSGYHKIGFNSFRATENFGGDEDFEEFTSRSVTYYGEVGLAEDLALFASIPFQDLEQIFDGNRTSDSGIGDVELGFRYNWIDSPVLFSTAFTFKLPYFYDDNSELPLGNGQEDYELKLLFGNSLGKFGYWGAEAGYRLRTDFPSDEYRYVLEYGINLSDNLYFRSKLDGIKSVGNASDQSSNDAVNLARTSEFDLGKLELATGWNFGSSGEGNWGLEFAWTKDLYGSNILEGENFQLGLIYQH